MKMTCLIIDEMHSSIVKSLEKIGFGVDYLPEIKRNEILSIINSYQGLIFRSKTAIDEQLISKAENLKFIGRAGAGIDLVDKMALKRRNICLVNAPEGNQDAVAEHAIGMLLCLLNKMHIADTEVRQKQWYREKNRGVELKDKTVGIIGYGFMGKAFAQRLKCFGCKILAYDKYKKDFSDNFVQEVDMQQIFEQTDILSLHIPLTKETENLVNSSYLQSFKKNIYLVNTARGKIVNLQDLNLALENNKVIATALDVLENETLKNLTPQEKKTFEQLSTKKNILFTPHVAGWTYESYKKISEVLAEKIAKLIK